LIHFYKRIKKMPISWKQLIGDCQKLSNCKIICSRNEVVESHKIVLGSISPFLRRIISDIPTGDDITFFMPDFSREGVEEFLGSITLNETPCSLDLQRAFGYEAIEKGSISYSSQELSYSKEVHDEEESEEEGDDGFYRYNQHSEYVSQAEDGNNSKERKNRFIAQHHVRTAVSNPGELAESLVPNPLTAHEIKNNEKIQKQILYETAIAEVMSGECKTLSEASKKFNIARSTLRDLVKADRKYTGRGRKSQVFTDDEEKIISERVLERTSGGRDLSWKFLKEMIIEELNIIKINHPERDFARISCKNGNMIEMTYVRRFAERNNLSRFLLQKFTKPIRNFECDICGSRFTMKNVLEAHRKRIHFSFLQ